MKLTTYIKYFTLITALFSNLLNAQSLVVPSLVSPVNNATNATPNELLDWSSSTGANAYEYRIGISSNLSNTPAGQVAASQATLANLFFGTLYYWQVRAIKTTSPTDSSNWSAVRSFTTIDQIFLVTPANGATSQAPNEILDWSPLSGITNYDYQWDTTTNFNSPLLNSASISSGSSQVTTSNLRFGTIYYWRIRARHSVDTTQWSAVRSFTTIDQIFLLTPANGATNQSPDEILDWSPLSGITNYDYQWDTSANFNSPLLNSASISSGSSQVTTSNLRFGTTYFWRVRARHSVDTTQWSAARFFTTIDQIFLLTPANGATSQAPNEILDWSPLSGINNYDYQWDTTSSFNSPLLNSASISSGSSQVTTSNLRFGTIYYWRVRARHSADTSQWSAVRFFTTTDQIFLVSPANGATNVATNPVLDWGLLSGITGYQYQLDTLFNFSTSTIQTIGSGSSQVST